MQKITNLLKIVWCFIVLLSAGTAAGQTVYMHDFGTTPISTYPYVDAPATLDSHLTGSTWTNSLGSWVSYGGSSGQALGLSNSSGTPTITLAFNVQPGYQLSVSSFSFWRQRSGTGAQNWAMAINGIPVGTGTVPANTGSNTGNITVSQPVDNLTGTVNVVLTLSGATGGGTFRLDDFTLNGSITGTCVAPDITMMQPTTGPYNTVVTLNGSGFNVGSGTTAVTFNGVPAAGFTVVSDNIVKAVVPAAATTGPISIITNGCAGNTGTFTVLNGNCPATALPSDLYISEVYDQNEQSGGMIELYNASGSTITFNGQYVLQRYGNVNDPSPTLGYVLALTGTLLPEATLLVGSSTTGTSQCNVPSPTGTNAWGGINNNDKIELLKNGAVIDVVHTPASQPGFTMIRKPDAIAPSSVYNASDWNITLHPVPTPTPNTYCADLGNHTVTSGPAREISAQPFSLSVCENETATFTLTINDPTDFTYQWKVLDENNNWINLADGANYTGTTSPQLVISNTPLNFLGNQYYCLITNGSCVLVSNAVQLTVSPLPVVTITSTQPTCASPTGSISIVPSVGDALTYSLDGTNYGTSTTFVGLTPNTYLLYVKSGSNCVSMTPFTINPVSGTPDPAVATLVQPTCTSSTGSIEITSPTGTGLSYSIDGTNFQTGTSFTSLAAGTYTITVQNGDGCTSTASVTLDPAPNTPATPVFTVVQPTCLTQGTVTVTAPLGIGLTYSLGGAFQASPLFTGIAPGTYTLTVRNAANCTSTATVILDPVPTAPLAATVTVTQPTCSVTTGSIAIDGPLGADLTYSINGQPFQATPLFTNLAPGTYVITTLNLLGCTSVSATITINPVPGAPATPVVSVVQPTCSVSTGSIEVTTPLNSAYTYSLNGGSAQTSPIFVALAPGNYTITVDNGAGCLSTSSTITINSLPSATVPTFTVTQPTCTNAQGSITVTNPVSGATYSINGGTPQSSGTFAGLAAGTYTITVDDNGCTASTGTITLNAAPGAPAVPTFTVTQPTCTNAQGSITVTNLVSGATYSINGGTPQSSGTFTGLAAGTYTITVDDNGCTASTGTITLNAAPGAPAVPTFTVTQPTCTNAQGSITVTNPVSGATYSINGGTPQNSGTFTGLAAGTYTITVDDNGCTATTASITVNPVPAAPAVPTFTVTQPTCTNAQGSITVTNLVSGATYSINGGTPQSSGTFTGLAAGTYTITVDDNGCTASTGTITLNAAPGAPAVPTFTVTQPTCTNAQGSITVTNLVSGATYSINGGTPQSSGTFTGLAAGTYTITVNDNGCTASTGTITLNAAPGAPAVPTFTVTQPTCTNAQGSITVTNLVSGATYSINGGTPQSSGTFTGLAAGTYTITVDDNGCTASTGTITLNAAPGAPAVPTFTVTQPTCTNAQGSITVTNLVSGATYSINGGTPQSSGTFTGLAAGTYTITVNDNGCTATTASITVNPVPAAPAVPTFTVTQPTCTNAQGSITVTNQVSGATYSINGGTPQSSGTFTGLAAGTYTITVNDNGCTATTASITVNPVPGAPAVPTFTVAQPTCTNAQGSITITNPLAGATYSLNGGTPQSAVTFAGLSAGNYVITVDNGSGCSASTASITVNAPLVVPAPANVSIVQPTCQVQTGTITINTPIGAGLTYSLNGGTPQSSAIFTGLTPGGYTIVVQNSDGCSSTAVSAVVDPLPAGPATPTVTVYHPNCGQTTGAITVDAPVGGVSYSIDGTNFQPVNSFSGLAPGNYTITVRDNTTNCSTTSATIVIDQPIAPPAITSVEGCQDNGFGRQYLIVTSPAAGSFDPDTATYEWRNAQGTLIGSESTLNVSQYVSMNGVQMDGTEYTVTLKVIVPGGCSVTQNFTFESVFCDIPKGISPNGDTKNDTFDLTGFNATKVSIFNRYGKEVYSRSNYTNEWMGQSDNGDELPTGTYYYVVELANNTRTGWVYINREE